VASRCFNESVKIGGNVGGVFDCDADVRHGGLRVHRVRVDNPVRELCGLVGKHAGDVLTNAHSGERRPNEAVCAANARN
jgi:hypothetical protein